MNQLKIIDGDGHIFEDGEAIARHFPYRAAAGRLRSSVFPTQSHIQFSLTRRPPGSFGIGPDGRFQNPGPEGWVEFMDQVGFDYAVLFPTAGQRIGRIVDRDRRLLLQRWTQDYDFRTSNRRVGWFLAPRGLHAVNQKIPTIPKGFRISSTGPSAAPFLLADRDLIAVLPLTTAAYYAQDIDALAEILGVVESPQQAAANVIIAEPRDLNDSDLLRAFGGGPSSVYWAPPVQVLADLATMGGRYPELAEQILQALTEDEPS